MAESQDANRRLTVILAADAVGYSKMMSRDEDGTIQVLEGHRTVIDAIIAAHGGRIISTAGDSVLAEFTSAVAAVRCATEMQEALKTRNDKLPENQQLLFRVGVNLGDVVVKGLDLLGDGVNVAARLESIAEPGGICIASSVYDQITGKLDLGFTDMGEQNLKNITRPIRAYQVGGPRPLVSIVPTAPAAMAARVEAPRRSSLAPMLVGGGVLGIAIIAVALAVAWDRGRATAVATTPPAPVPAPIAPKPSAPPVVAPATPSATGPKTDAAFAALAAGEAAPSSNPAPVSDWVATFSCAAYRDMPAGTTSSRASLRDGEFLVEPGVRGQQSYWRISGRPARDNSLVLSGTFVSPGARSGPEGNARFDGRLSGDRYLLDGHLGPRNCSLTIARSGR
jgi:class 3 adenylate cyclase